jgi:adenylate cyclase
MSETRKLAAILVSDIVGYSRLAGTDEDRILARLRTLRSDLIDPIISVHHGRIIKRAGDGSIIEFRSVVDAVRCALEVQTGMVERNAGLPPEKRIEFRVGIHLGDVVEEADGDLMGDGVNVAARLEGICEPGGVCLSEDAYRQVKSRLELQVADLGLQSLKNIAEPVRAYLLRHGAPATQKSSQAATKTRSVWARWPALAAALALVLLAAGVFGWRAGYPPRFLAASVDDKLANAPRLSVVVLPFENLSDDKEQDYFADAITEDLTTDLSHLQDAFVISRGTAFTYKGKPVDAKQIGKDLGVRYVLEGSVRRVGETITIDAQLILTETRDLGRPIRRRAQQARRASGRIRLSSCQFAWRRARQGRSPARGPRATEQPRRGRPRDASPRQMESSRQQVDFERRRDAVRARACS